MVRETKPKWCHDIVSSSATIRVNRETGLIPLKDVFAAIGVDDKQGNELHNSFLTELKSTGKAIQLLTRNGTSIQTIQHPFDGEIVVVETHIAAVAVLYAYYRKQIKDDMLKKNSVITWILAGRDIPEGVASVTNAFDQFVHHESGVLNKKVFQGDRLKHWYPTSHLAFEVAAKKRTKSPAASKVKTYTYTCTYAICIGKYG
jgi:hypothetical protein